MYRALTANFSEPYYLFGGLQSPMGIYRGTFCDSSIPSFFCKDSGRTACADLNLRKSSAQSSRTLPVLFMIC